MFAPGGSGLLAALLFARPPAPHDAAPLRVTCEGPPAPEPYARSVALFCAERERLGVPGASLALAERGALTLLVTAGDACRDGAPVLPDTPFRIGSVTKILTAALALRHVDEGRLALDAPLADLLPELAAGVDDRARQISLRHLLTHTSGLPDLDASALGPGDAWLSELGERPLLAGPGRLWSYANVGYALVGLALGRLTGEPYAAQLARLLDTSALTVDLDEALRRSPACGHLGPADPPLDLRADLELGAAGALWTIPAGGAVASPAALVELVLRLFDPLRSTLSAPAIAELLAADTPTHERLGEAYGLGVRRVALARGGPLFAHAGATGDFAADLYFAPDRGFALAVVGNRGTPLRASALAALHDLLGLDLAKPAPPAPLQRYLGAYHDPALGTLRVELQGDALALWSPELGLLAPLRHLGDHRFHHDGRDVLFIFLDQFSGDRPATYLRLRTEDRAVYLAERSVP